MPNSTDEHPSDETLELYSLGRLAEPDAGVLEEHLLVCERCRQRTLESDEYVAAMRRALLETQIDSTRKTRHGFLKRVSSVPKPVWVGALAATLLLVAIWPNRQSAEPPYEVQLTAYRGEVPAQPREAPAGRQLALEIDVTGLPALGSYLVEVVDSAGATVQRAILQPGGETLRMSVDPLAAGHYWVRVYEPAGGGSAPGELLREVALQVRRPLPGG